MTYDGCGNMLTKGSTAYTWTQGRRLSGVENGKSIKYYYDHTGARVKKEVDGTTTEYRMAGRLIVSEKTGSSTQWYYYDTASNIYAVGIGSSRYFCQCNIQGDVVGLIDGSGNVVVEYQYDSWGNTVSITGSLADTVGQKNPFRYRGYYYDTETGLYYVGSRYYDAGVRRFISADTTDVLTASTTALTDKNLYAYCDNNPVVRKDAGGKFWESVFDVLSLGASIVEVCVNPTDIWAWAGLVGDTIDLAPFVTGVGEATRAVKTTVKVVDKTTDILDTANTLYKTEDVASDIRKATGSYEILYKSGRSYIGKGGFNRAITSAKIHAEGVDDILSIRWKSAPSSREAFIDEYLMQKRFGGVLRSNPELPTYNIIWSPGRKYYGR